ncbi:MAG: hypothetical protein QM820_13320 [Minicystis sp.]
MASIIATERAPADWPAMVTRAGSPPKAAMLARTQRSAAILIEQAGARDALGIELGDVEISERAEAVVDGHDHDVAVARELRAVVAGQRSRAREEGSAVHPHEHGS